MPFMSLNGVTVPIDSASVNYTQVMADSKSLMGYARKGRVGRKRSWACKTPWMDADLAQALAGIISSRGDAYGFNDLTLFSDKGMLGILTAGGSSNPIFMTNSAAADGSYNPESPNFSGYSIYAATGYVNRLATNDATFESSNPLSTVNFTTAAQDGTRYYQGTKSVLVTDPGGASGRGVQSAVLTGFTTGNACCFSVMVYNGLTGPLSLTLTAQSSGGSTLASSPVTLPAGGWSRIYVPFTMASGGFRWRLVQQGSTACSWWVDAAMLEYATSPSPWVAPGAAAVGSTAPMGTGNFAIPFGGAALAGLPDTADGESSVGMWVQFSGLQDVRTLFNLRRDGTSPQISVGCAAGALTLNVTADNGTLLYSLSYTVPNSNVIGVWHYLVVNVRQAPRKGGNWAELWVDGTLQLAAPAANLYVAEPPNLNRLQELQMFFGISAWPGQINEIQLNPFVLPGSVIAQLYAAQPTVRPTMPLLALSGGIVGNQTVSALGSKVTLGPMYGHQSPDPNVGLQTMTQMSFTLDEV